MNDSNYDMIFKRKSFHLFVNTGIEKINQNELLEIKEAYKKMIPLCPNIKTEIKIVPAHETTCKRGQEYCVLFYSEKKDIYLHNIGYMGEQMDLFLVSKNIGTLWFGIGKLEENTFEGLDFVIMIAISKIDSEEKFRKDMFKSKRKGMDEIWSGQQIDDVSNIVRFAPSSCNTQPWFVEHVDEQLKVYRYKINGKRGIIPVMKVSYYNKIGIGIFIYFMDLCLVHSGLTYDKKIKIDDGYDDEVTLVVVYNVNHKVSHLLLTDVF